MPHPQRCLCLALVFSLFAISGCKQELQGATIYCSDGELNNGETDLDCGGENCEPCGLSGACLSDEDCASGVCLDLSCAAVKPIGTPGVVELQTAQTVFDLGTPFDVNADDAVGPDNHNSMYGRQPEIVIIPDGDDGLYIGWRDHGTEGTRTLLTRLERRSEGFAIAHTFELASLGILLGLTMDAEGNFYYATGSPDPDVNLENPPVSLFREGIVRLLKFDRAGVVSMDVDVDSARSAAAENPEQIIRPTVASTGRLAVGGGEVMLIHGINTPTDDQGVRHQKALTTIFDKDSGAIKRTDSLWVSHSFDQRLLYDGRGFIELHLGDAFPRTVVFSRTTGDKVEPPHHLMHVKGNTGQNNTFTRLGNFVLTGADDFAYMGVMATERSETTEIIADTNKLAGIRDLALFRVRGDFETFDPENMDLYLDTAGAQEMSVPVDGQARTNKIRWLTSYGLDPSTELHAERPKLVALGQDRFMVLWERWTRTDYQGTFAMLLDATGAVLVPETLLTPSAHLQRGDDAIVWGGEAVWVTGDKLGKELWLHTVDDALNYTRVVLR